MKDTIKYYEDKHDIRVLYLVKFGSHLYGTSTKDSDTDYKGLFLPSKESCYLNTQSKHINYTSGENDSKNGVGDIDFELWSLQYWVKLLQKGDTNAMDLLYSYSFPEIVEYIDPEMKSFLENAHKMFDIDKCNSYIGYVRGQVAKYGIKGERVGVYKGLHETNTELVKECNPDAKLNLFMNYLLDNHHDPSYCFEKMINDKRCLVVCGKVHMGDIKLNEFHERIKKEYDKYGQRARAAEQGNGIDWKAVSHAMRAVYQMKELIITGRIQFPLTMAPVITDIKLGKMDWKEVSDMIYNGLNEVDTMIDGLTDHKCKRDHEFVKNGILELYKS